MTTQLLNNSSRGKQTFDLFARSATSATKHAGRRMDKRNSLVTNRQNNTFFQLLV